MIQMLPVPPGFVWNYPGFPSIMVTYGVADDFYYSGHVGMIVLTLIQFYHHKCYRFFALALITAPLMAFLVLVTRIHYTLDVTDGVYAAIISCTLSDQLYKFVDRKFSELFGKQVCQEKEL